MNLALHGFLLQVILSILDLQHGFRLCSAGEPGYLDFDNLPETNFSCQGKVIGGYYADVEAGCQMFHVCTIGQKDEIMDIKFLCLNGTVFDQETRVCERVDEVDCSKSERFYNLNLELYGNNAVTLSLHENESAEGEQVPDLEDHQTTSARPSTTTTTPRPISSTTAASGPFQHPSGYPQHYQPQPPFPSIQTSQSKSHYDDKNGGYHRQYIYHIPEQNDPSHATSNDRATSFQLFSSQGGASSTTGAPPQVHQIHYSSTPNPPASVSTIYHGTSTIQTLLGGVINPIFHNIASTTDFPHSQTPRESPEYDDDDDADLDDEDEDNHRRYLEPIQSTSQGKISKLSISPVPSDERKSQKDAANFLNIPPSGETSVKSFYPTPKASSKASHVTQHIHILPPYAIPQLKPHQVTINLPPPDIQRIVQNPSPLLPSQSRVIITAKASVSDESGRPLNTTQLVTLPQPTVPTSYDEYKEGDESFDPFYRDVPKIRNARALPGTYGLRRKRSLSALEADEPSETGDTVEYTTQGSDNVEDLTLPGFREDIDSGEVTSTSVEDVDTSQDDEEPIKEVGTTQEPLDDAEISDEREENISATDSQAKSEELHDDYEEYINSNEYSEVADAPATENDSQIAGVTEITAGKNDSLQINFTTDSTPETATISMGNSSGVLVFTDEIPTSESQETMENIENKPVADPLPLDYVDDNYEPNNYQAQEHLEAPADKKAISKSEFMNYQVPIDRANVSNSIPKAILTTAPDTTTFSILTSTETSTTETSIPITVLTSQVTSETPMTTLTAATIIPTASETTSTDTPTSTEPKTTLPTVEATTEADIESTMGDISTETTLSPTTTTKAPTKRRRPLKPTLGNIIRAFSTKKSHIYIPPTTTPVPVIIKSRRPLKANRLKSNKFYNDSPPKPAIKRRQFSLRKSTSTEASWPEVEEDFTSQKNAELTETTVETKEIQDGTTPLSVETFVEKMPKEVEAVTEGVTVLGESLTTTKKIEDVFTVTPETLQTTTEVVDVVTSIDAAMLTSVRPVNRKPALQKPASAFNCLEVELYRFYGDKRDCRLFHYCSPGFTSRQILDFRFVCEEGTIFDEDSQNCVHQVENPKCKNRNW